ncbi:hypothetical protein M6B38_195475 [Iris pallida]|uniref:Uncharacterized protein n=1 Tax=Iris pallida TaxID=29817 RepID=A0AAX6ED57_IRIPA|nr:hypothetical protein M6B38_195475 [Iris pallida]
MILVIRIKYKGHIYIAVRELQMGVSRIIDIHLEDCPSIKKVYMNYMLLGFKIEYIKKKHAVGIGLPCENLKVSNNMVG